MEVTNMGLGLDYDEYTVECRACGELYEVRPEDCDEYGAPGCPHCEKRRTLKLDAGEHLAVTSTNMFAVRDGFSEGLWNAIKAGNLKAAAEMMDRLVRVNDQLKELA